MIPAPPRQVLARRQDTSPADLRETGRTTRLPTEVLSEQATRLTVFTTVAAVLWSFALLMDIALLPALSDTWVMNWRIIPIEIVGALGSVIMRWYLRRADTSAEHKGMVGLGMMLMNAALIAVVNAWAMPAIPPEAPEIGRPSWIALLILIFAMIAPGVPRQMLATSLVAASFDPLALLVVWLLGVPAPSLVQLVIFCWPSYACAFVVVVPAKVLHRMSRRLKEAQELGSYQLIERLGQGGMGEVWRAEHRFLARDAAIKLVRPEVLGARNEQEAQNVLRRFEREAQATAALNSPHTIQVFDFGITQEGTFYYVMELLAGRDLESLVREFGPLPAARTIYLLRQVCHSLADAHARGLVHRDIKPANIYVCRMGLDYDFAKVLDFGLVKIRSRSTSADSLTTMHRSTTGTPAYMAPECIVGDVEVDRRADVYAFGCVAYFALTGSLVFDAENSMQMLMHHLHTEPVRPSEKSELPIPRELDDLILACLKKDPSLRPQNAGELLGMAYSCRCSDEWGQDEARHWWQVHLPNLTGSLTVGTRRDRPEHVVSV
jgi:tRNA A-37 threonylcarbamoyl transferase component Bud32